MGVGCSPIGFSSVSMGGGGSGVRVYANLAAFPATAPDGTLAVALDTNIVYEYDVGTTSWKAVADPAVITAVGSATSSNTPSTIVKRDGSGDFSAGTITANLTGNASGTAANVTGIVAVANGGTGVDSSATAINKVLASPASGLAGAPTFRSLVSDDIPVLDAAKITSGTFDIGRIPIAALERLVIVADATARHALTTATVQNGDTVKQTDTGEMWYVYDDTQLNVDAGYRVYTAGSASTVPWTGITGKAAAFGLAGQIPYSTGSDLTSDANLTWDSTNKSFRVSNGSNTGATIISQVDSLASDRVFIRGIGPGGSPATRFAAYGNGVFSFGEAHNYPAWFGRISCTNSASVPLAVQGASGQTANMQQWLNNLSGVLAYVDVSGGASFTGLRLGQRTVTSAPTLTDADYTIFCDATTAGFSVALPAAASNAGRILNIVKVDATANTVTIDPNLAETIDGAATYVITEQYDSITCQCSGTAWFII